MYTNFGELHIGRRFQNGGKKQASLGKSIRIKITSKVSELNRLSQYSLVIIDRSIRQHVSGE